MVGNENDGSSSHKHAFDTVLEQVVSGVSINYRKVCKSTSEEKGKTHQLRERRPGE